MQVLWGHIWKHTVEKSQTNAASVIMQPLGQAIWRPTWKNTVDKSEVSPSAVRLYLSWLYFKSFVEAPQLQEYSTPAHQTKPVQPPSKMRPAQEDYSRSKVPDTKSIGSRIAEVITYLLEELLSPTKLAVSRDRFHLSRKDIRKGYLFMCLISNQHINIW